MIHIRKIKKTNKFTSIFFLITVLFFAYSKEIDPDQDWASYLMNLENKNFLLSITKSFSIFFWYYFLLYPIQILLGSSELALLLVKLLIVAICFYVYQKKIKNKRGLFIILLFLIFVPAFTENYQEFLRQGTSIAILLFSFTTKNKYLRYLSLALSALFHFVAFVPIIFFYFSRVFFGINKFNNDLCKRSSWTFPSLSIVLILSVFVSFYFLAIGNQTLSENKISFFQGNRTSIFAIIYLFVYGSYLLIIINKSKIILHIVSFLIVSSILFVYTFLTDFGRMISLVIPIHFASTVLIDEKLKFNIDALATIVFGTVLTIIY